MTEQLKAVLEAAMSLPPDDRVELAEGLMWSLDEAYQEKVERAWNAEIDRRLDEIHSGRAELVDGDEALRRLRDRRKV